MAEVICENTDAVEWAHWRRLAEKIDEMAVNLATPGYTPLTTDTSLPYVEASLPSVSAVMEFDLDPHDTSGPRVIGRRLVVDFGGAAISWPGTPMTGTGAYEFYGDFASGDDNNALYFVHENDDCLCKTIFRVNGTAGAHTLDATTGADPEHGCCQTIEVPKIDDRLDYSQNFIPAGQAAAYAKLSDPARPGEFFSYYCPACVPPDNEGCSTSTSGGDIRWDFDSQTGLVLKVSRKVTGHLTWPIRADMINNLLLVIPNKIIKCGNNGGLKPRGVADLAAAAAAGGASPENPTLWAKESTYETHGGYVDSNGWYLRQAGCGVEEIEPWLASLGYEFDKTGTGLDVDETGTLVDGATFEDASLCTDLFDRPWDTPTGGGSNCGSTGRPSVYCQTVNQFSFLIEEVEARLFPYGEIDVSSFSWNTSCIPGGATSTSQPGVCCCYEWSDLYLAYVSDCRESYIDCDCSCLAQEEGFDSCSAQAACDLDGGPWTGQQTGCGSFATPVTVLTPPGQDTCQGCSTSNNPCCLRHTTFEDSDGCVQYIADAASFFDALTDGMIHTFTHNVPYTDSALCGEAKSNLYCLPYASWPTDAKNCLDMAVIPWYENEVGSIEFLNTSPTVYRMYVQGLTGAP